MGFVVSGKGVDFPMSHGLRGGYPGAPARYIICRGAQNGETTNLPLPLALEEIGGKPEAANFGVYHVYEQDIFYVNWNGAGGVRDPLDRDPVSVCTDIAEGVVSPSAARNLYGVVLARDASLDVAGTQALRESMRRERMGAPDGRAISGGKTCTHGRCAGNDATTMKSLQRRLSDIDGSYTSGATAMLAEMVCKQCGSLLDSEVTMLGVPPLFDGATIEEVS
jgi:hypothetical protein